MLNARTGAAAALIVVTCTASACRKAPENTSAEQPAQAAAQTAGSETPAPAKAPEPPPKPVPATIPPVVARVNGQDIPKRDFDRLVKQLELQAGQAVPQNRRDEIYRAVLDQLVTYTALVQEAKARDIKVSAEEAKEASDAKLAELRQQIPDPKAFNQALAERDMTVERLRTDIRNDMAVSKMMEAELAGAPAVSDAEVREFYEKNPDEFATMRASHILIRPQGPDELSKQKARAEAEDILQQAKNGTDFAELARKHSADGSAQQGGDLGPPFTKGRMVPQFSSAAFALKPGEISNVVETEFGYHIIKALERKDITLAEADASIRNFLTARRRDEMQKAFVANVKNKSKIEVLF